MNRFANKVVVITGGNSGIGLATAQLFQNEGGTVVVSGRDQATLAAAGKTLGKDAVTVKADVTVMADLDRLFATVKLKYGRVDVLFANAGAAKLSPLEATSEALFDEMMNINCRGAYFTAQKALPLLSTGGAIIFNTTFFGHLGVAGTSSDDSSYMTGCELAVDGGRTQL
jgi:NAD(P)-dependent dehydrogenase (short-subunit alcohol dehydrogenase family)